MDLDGLEPSISCVLPPFSVPHVGSPFVALLTSAGGKGKKTKGLTRDNYILCSTVL